MQLMIIRITTFLSRSALSYPTNDHNTSAIFKKRRSNRYISMYANPDGTGNGLKNGNHP